VIRRNTPVVLMISSPIFVLALDLHFDQLQR